MQKIISKGVKPKLVEELKRNNIKKTKKLEK